MILFQFNKLITDQRERKGISLSELTQHLPYSVEDLSRMEKGYKEFPAVHLVAWAHAIGMDPDIMIAELANDFINTLSKKSGRPLFYSILPRSATLEESFDFLQRRQTS